MLTRREINQRYYEKHKEELNRKRKEKEKEKKKEKMKNELSQIDFKERNIYLDKLNSMEMDDYCVKRKKSFNLKYDLDHYDTREKGDKEKYFKEKKEAFTNYCAEMDLKFRLEKYRLFRNSYLKLYGKEPNLTAMVVNDNFVPEEVNPKSERYDEKLLSYLEEQEGDEEVKIREVCDESDEE